MRPWSAISAALLFGLSSATGQTIALDWNFAHSGAEMLGSINVKALRESPHWQTARRSAPEGSPQMAAMQQMMAALADIDVAAISVQSRVKGQTADLLLQLGGRFESGSLKRTVEQYAKTASVRQISPSLLLVGEPASVEAALKRMASPRAFPPGLQARARQLAAEHDLMICGAPKAVPAQAKIAAGLKEFVAGVSFGSTAVSTVEIETQTAAAADSMIAQYNKAMADFVKGPAASPASPPFRALAQLMKVQRTSPTHLSFRIEASPADIQSIQALAPTLSPGMVRGMAEAMGDKDLRPAQSPQRAPEGKIVIHGMEGGPREIPMK